MDRAIADLLLEVQGTIAAYEEDRGDIGDGLTYLRWIEGKLKDAKERARPKWIRAVDGFPKRKGPILIWTEADTYTIIKFDPLSTGLAPFWGTTIKYWAPVHLPPPPAPSEMEVPQ